MKIEEVIVQNADLPISIIFAGMGNSEFLTVRKLC